MSEEDVAIAVETSSPDQRQRILDALARGDRQRMDNPEVGRSSEMLYGQQADAVALLIAQETRRFVREYVIELRRDMALIRGEKGDRAQRKALSWVAGDLTRAAKAVLHKAQAAYNESGLSRMGDWPGKSLGQMSMEAMASRGLVTAGLVVADNRCCAHNETWHKHGICVARGCPCEEWRP